MAVCELYNRGFSLRSSGFVSRRKGGGKRGKLTGKYSAASFRRLREYVITHTASGSCWGLTFTVPGIDNLTPADFKVLHHSFSVWLAKWRYPLVWRVELQQRGMPHLHCVFFGDAKQCLLICEEWFRLLESRQVWSVEKVSDGQSELVEMPRAWVYGSSHAVNLCKLDGGFSAFRYLVAHMSKAKKAQLGWTGRNWGVVARDKFSEVEKRAICIREAEYVVCLRWVRRWTRRRVFSRRGCSWWVSDSRVLGRMLDYISERKPNGGGAESAVPVRGARALWLYSWFGLQWLQNLDFLTFDLVLRDTLDSCCRCIEDIVSFYVFVESTAEKVPF